jgi:hypothetical protein
MPGGGLAQLNHGYKLVYTDHWLSDFPFTKKGSSGKSTAGIDAKKIARLLQTFLAYALPHVEVFGVTGSLYNRASKKSRKDIEFTFQLKEIAEEGGIYHSENVVYRGTLKNPLGREVEEGTVPNGVLYRGKEQVIRNYLSRKEGRAKLVLPPLTSSHCERSPKLAPNHSDIRIYNSCYKISFEALDIFVGM